MTPKSSLLQLRENEREVRKNLIIDAAVRLFAQKPFNQVSIRDIASEAGISPASIYRYFSDRDELFIEAFSREGKKISDTLFKLLEEKQNAPLDRIAADYIDYLIEHDTFFQMMTHFMIESKINERALEKFNAAERRLLDIFDTAFRKLGVTKNVRLHSHAFFAALNGILITFRNYPGRSKEEVKKHMHRLSFLLADVFKQATLV